LALLFVQRLKVQRQSYFDDYRKGHEKGFLEKVFEDGIRRYQEQIKQR
jgi:hypothetical protein